MHFIKFYYIQQDSNAKLELALNLLAEQREHNRKQDERMQQLENEIRQLRDERQGTAVKSINGQPESCEDLKALGHSLNGFYSVRSNNALHSVFCDFSKSTGDSGKKCACSCGQRANLWMFVDRFSIAGGINGR